MQLERRGCGLLFELAQVGSGRGETAKEAGRVCVWLLITTPFSESRSQQPSPKSRLRTASSPERSLYIQVCAESALVAFVKLRFD